MFTKRQIIYLFIVVSIQLIVLSRICFSKSIGKQIDNNIVKQTKVDENNWFNRLIINLLSYALVLIPSALLVFLVKNQFCLKSGIDSIKSQSNASFNVQTIDPYFCQHFS